MAPIPMVSRYTCHKKVRLQFALASLSHTLCPSRIPQNTPLVSVDMVDRTPFAGKHTPFPMLVLGPPLDLSSQTTYPHAIPWLLPILSLPIIYLEVEHVADAVSSIYY